MKLAAAFLLGLATALAGQPDYYALSKALDGYNRTTAELRKDAAAMRSLCLGPRFQRGSST